MTDEEVEAFKEFLREIDEKSDKAVSTALKNGDTVLIIARNNGKNVIANIYTFANDSNVPKEDFEEIRKLLGENDFVAIFIKPADDANKMIAGTYSEENVHELVQMLSEMVESGSGEGMR